MNPKSPDQGSTAELQTMVGLDTQPGGPEGSTAELQAKVAEARRAMWESLQESDKPRRRPRSPARSAAPKPTDTLPVWDGRRSLGNIVAMFVDGGSTTDRSLVVGAATTKKKVVVDVQKLGEFFEIHAHARIACFDAGHFHWTLYDELKKRQDECGLAGLWFVSAECRLIDVVLLEERLHVLGRGVFPLPKPLGILLADAHSILYGHYWDVFKDAVPPLIQTLESNSSHEQRAQAAAELAKYLETVCKCSLADADERRRQLKISRSKAKEYGPLGLGIDVQGAIALAAASRAGIETPPAQARDLLAAVETEYQRCSQILWEDCRARDCFVWGEQQRLVVREDGYPQYHKDEHERWLRHHVRGYRDALGVRVLPALLSKGSLSTLPQHWGKWLQHREELEAWGKLVSAAEVSRWLGRPLEKNEPVLARPRYQVIPEISAREPNLDYIASLKRKPFRPRPDHNFLIATLKHLELRCLAWIFQRRAPKKNRTQLAKILSDGQDPIAAVVAYHLAASSPPGVVAAQPSGVTDAYQKAEVVTTVMLHSFPDSWVARSLAVSGLAIDNDDIRQMRSALAALFPELKMLFDQQTIASLARRTKHPIDKITDALFVEQTETSLPKSLTRALDRRVDGQSDWSRLLQRHRRSDPVLPVGLPDENEARELGYNIDWPVTDFGRVGRPVYATQQPGQICREMRDEIIKSAAYEVVAAGHTLVAVAGVELVIEARSLQAEALRDALSQIAQTAVERRLGPLARGCCTCRLADGW